LSTESDDYEDLTKSVVDALSRIPGIQTARLERDVLLSGRATQHQIDVLWEIAGPPYRVIFECRHYSTRLKQKDLLAFKGVVDDLRDDHSPVYGVMVTRTGYQSGARKVADTYGITILELRVPEERDTSGRAVAISLQVKPRMPFLRDLEIEPSPGVELAPIEARLGDIELITRVGSRTPLSAIMMNGELAALDEPPSPAHQVTRIFDPPATLIVEGREMGEIRRVRGIVGEEAVAPIDVRLGGREHLAHVLVDALGGERAWFTVDGRVVTTDR
jgi:hypothetical protein